MQVVVIVQGIVIVQDILIVTGGLDLTAVHRMDVSIIPQEGNTVTVQRGVQLTVRVIHIIQEVHTVQATVHQQDIAHVLLMLQCALAKNRTPSENYRRYETLPIFSVY